METAKYVTYKRVSTKEQGKSGLGLDAQEREIRAYFEKHTYAPWEVIGEFLDIDSGSDNRRPELKKAIAEAKKHDAVLLVSKLDRLSRRLSFVANLMEDKRPEFRVAQMPDADNFQLHIYAALAEQERKLISKRTKEALAEAKARGVKLGGLRDKTNQRNKVRKEEADRKARQLEHLLLPLKNQGATLREIADALNNANVVTSRGCSWHPTSVKRLLARLGA